jgi:MFS family permease
MGLGARLGSNLGAVASFYVIGAVSGALGFGWLTGRFGRRNPRPHAADHCINSAGGDVSATTMHAGALAERIRALRTTASRAVVN